MRQDFDRPCGRLIGPYLEPDRVRAPYAVKAAESLGRFHAESESRTRTPYQRDRDRIIHSTAFRRLKHKTQVFVQDEGDHYRTRLTHSLEVAQIARSLARVLQLDEDLAETVALAHDLGHTPFGHAGEEALNAATASIGGFDHNAHALRLVSKLEHRYAQFDGLNLTWETLEGLVKHNGPLTPPHAAPIASFDRRWPLLLSSWPSLEAQIAALSDDIAYVNHDLDDGLRAGLFRIDDLRAAPLAGPHTEAVLARFGALEIGRFIGEMVRTLMSALVDDLLEETRRRIAAAGPADAAGVRGQGGALAAFSPAMREQLDALQKFLFVTMYRHERVMTTMNRAKEVVTALFEAFSAEPKLLPADWAKICGAPGDAVTCGVARDYIAGMTDSFALAEYARVFHREISLSAP
ncbi:MAG: deoxyguanosinetriphosphate triphosphohydrolase [Alphaproteobacteria bacterium]|nr:deoxyguanosinetriphosphate triphosphohydrolase [Alphaproteobacteria bacterium]MBV9694988.1 deoxyguanosinetriphosphate triphosphohydrolase [Alphaproteobacteria bacterium]